MDTKTTRRRVDADELQRRLAGFERRYGHDSSAFAKAFMNGELNETPEFLEWSSLYAAWRLAVGRS